MTLTTGHTSSALIDATDGEQTELSGADGPSSVSEKSATLVRSSGDLFTTFLTTLTIFGIYFVQGIILARILGPLGRGEFGTAVLFSRDFLLYVGLFGGVDIINRFASNPNFNQRQLKYSAVTMGLVSGLITAFLGATISLVFLWNVDSGSKAYLIPFCILASLFVPFEHIHLNVSAVDRGKANYAAYNWNRLLYAVSFPLLMLLMLVPSFKGYFHDHLLLVTCVLFVVSKIIGLLPTLRKLSWVQWQKSFSQPITDQKKSHPKAKMLFLKGGPYAVSTLVTEIFERMDVLLVLALASVEMSGFYFVAIPAATLLTIAPNALAVFTFNAGAEGRNIQLDQAVYVTVGTILFQLVSLFVLWWLVPFLVIQFYGAPFEPAIKFVWYLLPACAIKGILQAMDGYLKGCGKPIFGIWSRSVSVLAMLLFVKFTFDQWGLVSIPLAACVGQAISLLIVTFFVFREIVNRQRKGGEELQWQQ